jgi:hypothetical protein
MIVRSSTVQTFNNGGNLTRYASLALAFALLLSTTFFALIQLLEQTNGAHEIFADARSNVPLSEPVELGIRGERTFSADSEKPTYTIYIDDGGARLPEPVRYQISAT